MVEAVRPASRSEWSRWAMCWCWTASRRSTPWAEQVVQIAVEIAAIGVEGIGRQPIVAHHGLEEALAGGRTGPLAAGVQAWISGEP